TAQVLHGGMSLGTMLALNALAASFLSPLSSLVSSGQTLQLISAQLERIADVLEAAPEQAPGQERRAPRLAGRVELRGGGVRYDAHGPWVLRDVTWAIEPGKKIAIVGRTGSGKSTLGMLLLGLHPPTDGEILYDGQPLGGLDLRSLRRQFGVVPQEPFLFSGSLRENIAFGAAGVTRDEVAEAARLAAIDGDVARMPMGYETRIAEGGTGLSGGQRQRLALARALASRPAFLLLDEATSHLDAVTEAQIDASLEQLACTRIVIAHRLSTIRSADLILVLDGGRIAE